MIQRRWESFEKAKEDEYSTANSTTGKNYAKDFGFWRCPESASARLSEPQSELRRTTNLEPHLLKIVCGSVAVIMLPSK